ncbi:heterokaryon incompatibility protein-domain-containing protein [Annulohypoxylon truncatum]|uniref:heterokaryon incompatibility protein-domain-containing protein n=1 Tax=Annulohypoxylon truncatum TaxID=327061 RepID=UPI002007F4E5|nr:heterokaryon incompatibility protein-domain-containing protein [Annulohypoxylon truncatum]KAI1210910.1 heterokaryon incompatibility protein-domain-containing protein [Annulohypoxylon truncatum]
MTTIGKTLKLTIIGTIGIYPALLNIRKSASEGCEFCALLRDSILSPKFKELLAADEVDTSAAFYIEIRLNYRWRSDTLPDGYECNRGLGSLEAVVDIDYEERFLYSYTFKFAIESTPMPNFNGGESDSFLAAQRLCEKWLRLRLNKTGYILTEERVVWLKGEIDRFIENHNPPSEPSFIPTRLIQVDRDIPRLVRKDDIARPSSGPIKYAALSCCWGNKEEAMRQYKTTKSTLAARLSGFEARKMSKVLCDAIQTARALSLSYIWVDALCIIQDDAEDWEQESIQMGRIYENAHVTFFTLSSNSCTQGFLERQPPQLRIPFRSKIKPQIEGAYGLRLTWIDTNWTVREPPDNTYIENDLQVSIWGTRGWTYQEQALSKACIWFGKSRTHFLCPDWSYTEGDATQSRAIPHFQLQHLKFNDNSESFRWDWYTRVVEQFTGRLFTNPTDRFPALSGLAQNFHELLGGEYLAGIWTIDLHKGLWFSCEKNRTPSFSALIKQLANPNIYVAPTWSWASRQGVTYHSHFPLDRVDLYAHPCVKDIRKAYQRVEGELQLMGADRFGRLKSGYLKVTGRTYHLQLSPDRLRKPQESEPLFSYSAESVVDSEDRTIVRCECDWAGSLTDVGSHVTLLFLGHKAEKMLSSGPELGELSDDDEVPEDRLAYGLLLYKALSSDKFYRIGIFWSKSEDGYGTAFFKRCQERKITLI